jgi:hypothetical protein
MPAPQPAGLLVLGDIHGSIGGERILVPSRGIG